MAIDTTALLHALAEPDQIRLMASLLDHARSVDELSAALELPAATIGPLLQALGKTGLLTTERQGHQRRYRIDSAALAELARSEGDSEGEDDRNRPPAEIAAFFRGNWLERMPAQRSRQLQVLVWLINDFETERDYGEAEVNRIIGRRHADYATIRRAFVDEGFMTRAAGIYRRRSEVGIEGSAAGD
jgi:DNA-binding transcriptional ArsR family regulator